MHIEKKHLATFLSLFLVIFIDAMGIVLVMPVLTTLLLSPEGNMATHALTHFERALLYGVGMGIFALFMFWGAPLLGDLSDRYGRKKILLLCLLGTVIGYLVSAVGVHYTSVFWLLMGRAICGAMAGSQPIAQAAIADMSTSESKAINLSMIVLAATLGVTMGPLIGGYTSDANVVSWFTLATPFVMAALIALINAVLLIFFFRETFQPKATTRLDLFKGLHLFLMAFKDKALMVKSGFFLCQLTAWALYFQAVSWLLLQEYHYNTQQLGWFTAYVGVAFSLALTVIIRLMMGWLRTEMNVFLVCTVVLAISNIAVGVFVGEWAQWFWAAFNAAAAALCYSMGLAIFSNSIGHERQGWIMGITGALGAVSWTFTGIAAGLTGYINIRLPYWICGGLAILSLVLALYYKKHYAKRS